MGKETFEAKHLEGGRLEPALSAAEGMGVPDRRHPHCS